MTQLPRPFGGSPGQDLICVLADPPGDRGDCETDSLNPVQGIGNLYKPGVLTTLFGDLPTTGKVELGLSERHRLRPTGAISSPPP